MNLLDILKQKKERSEIQINIEEKPHKTSYEEPNNELFLALYTPYIRNPYSFDWFIFMDYKGFLLDDSLYVLNTFPLLNIESIFSLYLNSKMKPGTLQEYTLLIGFLNHIHLNIPNKYQKSIEDIIRKNLV